MKKIFIIVGLSMVLLCGCGKENDSNAGKVESEISVEAAQSEEKESYAEIKSDKSLTPDGSYEIYISDVMDTVKKMDASDELTEMMVQKLGASYFEVLDLKKDNCMDSQYYIDFLLGSGYCSVNFGENTIGHEMGEAGLKAMKSLVLGDGDFLKHMGEFKSLYEQGGSTILSKNMVGPGQYKVGTDIKQGEYVLLSENGMGYFALTTDGNGNDIITNDNFEYNSMIIVDEGEYLELSRCKAIPLDEAKNLPIDKANMFKVGVHLPAGEYKLQSDTGMGYYCVYNDGRHDDIEANNNFEGQSYVSVKEGQYLLLSRCHIVE